MTNKDKYLKDRVDIAEFICGLRDYLDSHRDNYDTSNLMINYLNKPVKPTLTEDEKVILRNIQGFELIYRNSSGTLHFVTRRNAEVNHYCEGGIFRDEAIEDGECVSCINHLFQFIKPRRRI